MDTQFSHHKPILDALEDDLPDQVGRRLFACPVLDVFDSIDQAHPAHVADHLMLIFELEQLFFQIGAVRSSLLDEFLFFDDLKNGQRGRTAQWIASRG